MRQVYIIIGCDVDPDRPSFIPGVTAESLSWNGMLKGIPATKKITSGIQDSEGRSPIFSWCLRVDDQIKHYYNDYAWVLKNHRKMFQDLADSGDELTWHPHFWRLNSKTGEWYQEINDLEWQLTMLREAFAAYRREFPEYPRAVRMGWNYHNTSTMNLLAELGIKVDFSGVPGMRAEPSPGKCDNIYDWFHAPNRPYFPSRKNYQNESNDEALPMLEAPNLVASSFVYGLIAGLVLAKKMKNIKAILTAIRRPRYWINISAERKYFKPVLNQYRKELKRRTDQPIIFNNYFHPDDMVENTSPLYSLEGFRDNLQDLVNAALEAKARVKFIQAREAAAILTKDQ